MTSPWRSLLIAAFVGVAIFAGFSIYTDTRVLGQQLAGFRWSMFFIALSLALVNYAVRFLRWSLYLRAAKIQVPTRISLLTYFSSFALSVTPGKVGDLIKSVLLRDLCEVPMARSIPIVIAERVTDLLALAILALVGVAIYGIATGMVLAGTGVIVLGLIVLSWPALAYRVIGCLGRVPLIGRIGDRIQEVYQGLATQVRPVRLTWTTSLALVAWLSECVAFAVIISGFPETSISVGLATLIYAATTVAGALSFLPGGLLVTESAMTVFLVQSASHLDEPTAVAATILTRLATLWFAVALGMVAFVLVRRCYPTTQTPPSGDVTLPPENEGS